MLKKHIDFRFPVCYEEEGQKLLSAGNDVELTYRKKAAE